MKICLISYEYDPFPGGGIATYHNVAVKKLVEAGHEVHVVTYAAWHGSCEPSCTQRLWLDGNLHVHRIYYFSEKREVPGNAGFLDVVPSRYGNDNAASWTIHPSNQAAYLAAQYVESLHATVGFDIIESPEYFAETYYILRRRASGERHRFPPVCLHGHVSSRIAFGACQYTWELGYYQHRQMMQREEYCLQQADALITPSHSLMQRYVDTFGDRLPTLRDTLPYFLEVPSELPPVQRNLAKGRYLVTVGRVEPRKGSDAAIRAFAALADDYADLRLVLLGGENWHFGETVDDLIEAEVDPRHRDRIIRPGNVARDQALALARGAAAFLHPALWDNYPCAVMEAMAVGAVCIVSDQGGQAEMVEDGTSGLIVPAGDVAVLTDAVRKVLDDDALAGRLREGAVARMADLTNTERLVARKIAMYESICKAEAEATAGAQKPLAAPFKAQANAAPAKLPGHGLIVIDTGKASAESLASTQKSVLEELQSSPNWQVSVLCDPKQETEIPSTWTRIRASERPPWLDLDPDTTVVYVLAGVRFDFGKLGHLVQQLEDSRVPCGSFLWLRPASAHVFPYAADLAHHDILIGGRTLPPVFAVKARHLAQCNFLAGLFDPHQRLCALMAAASVAHGLLFQHTGTLCGDFYGELPFVRDDMQLRAMGYLDILDLLPHTLSTIGNIQIPTAPTADIDNRIEAARQEGRNGASGASTDAPPQPTHVPGFVDPHRIAMLEQSFNELNALKQMKAVRLMRKFGLFDFARKLFPKSKRMIGSGDRQG